MSIEDWRMTNQTIEEVLANIIVPTASKQENAVLLHNFVREKIKFGFNKYFDATPPDYTLACGFGHCNAKSRLIVAFFRSINLVAYQHFVAIPKDILRGAIPPNQFWMLPSELSHSYVEVKIEDSWWQIDSFTIDTPYLKAAQTRLAREGKSIGYGVRLDSDHIWDGKAILSHNSIRVFWLKTMVELTILMPILEAISIATAS